MYTISIVPEDSEVLSLRLKSSESFYSFIAVNYTARIWILRNAPYALNGFVFRNHFFDHIHIRTVVCIRYINHFNSKWFTYSKVTVITGYRTQELDLIKPAPRQTAVYTVCIGQWNDIIHYIKAWVAENHYFISAYFKQICKHCFCFRNTVKYAVVTVIVSVDTGQIAFAV